MALSVSKKSQLYFLSSFILLISLGTLLLKLPFAIKTTGALGWTDAIFTATSATCVTGLLTVKVAEFTLFGQIVLLLLIQLGGLGIMTLTASIAMLLGNRLSIGNALMMSSISDNFSLRGTEKLVQLIFRFMVTIELISALLLFPGFLAMDYTLPESIWFAIFHAVSAFCNAGISIFDQSLIASIPWIKMILSFTAILGGIGAYVLLDIKNSVKTDSKWNLNTRLTILTTTILLIGGTILIWGLEIVDGDKILWIDAFFQSTMCRSAGFNSVELGNLSSNTLIVMIVLMLIGASPGSTGGGMRTTTVALVIAAIISTFKGNRKVLLFNREIPTSNVLKAFSLIVSYLILICFGAIMIQILSLGAVKWTFFEAVSALGTVGMTLHNAPLTEPLKVFLIFYMFIGRIGLFTILLFFWGRDRQSRLQYPTERLMLY